MYRTCTVQANLDFSSEADMVKKLRVSLALQPVATALFANSPFTEGKPNGFLSFRSEIWRDTDNQRAGMLPFAFEDGMGFERYVDYALDVPMYFVKRGDNYIDVSGKSFRDFLAGKLAGLAGRARRPSPTGPTTCRTIFPGGAAQALSRNARRRRRAVAAAAVARRPIWVGLLYDDDALDACWDMVEGLERATSGRNCATRCRSSASRPRSATATCSRWRRRRCGCARAGSSAASGSTATAATRRAICGRWRRSSRAASRRRKNCWRNFRSAASGTARSSRSSTEYAY